MARFTVDVVSESSGPSWRTVGVPDGRYIVDTFVVVADSRATAERMALGEAEKLPGRVKARVKEVLPLGEGSCTVILLESRLAC